MRTLAKRTLLGVAILAVAAAAAIAADRGPAPGPPMFGPPGMGPMGGGGLVMHLDPEDLGLSDAQIEQLEKLREEHLATVRPLLDEHRRIAEEVRTALESGSTDAAAIGEKAIVGHALMQKLRAAGEDLESRFVALLDADQKARFEAMKAEPPQPRGPHGHGYGRGDGAPQDCPKHPDCPGCPGSGGGR